jgi:hypothetical protein
VSQFFIQSAPFETDHFVCFSVLFYCPHLCTTGIFVLTIGSSGCIPAVLAYSANNVVSHSKVRCLCLRCPRPETHWNDFLVVISAPFLQA